MPVIYLAGFLQKRSWPLICVLMYIDVLEIRTNDLVANRPEVVGSEIDDLVQSLLQSYSVRVIGVC